MPKLDIGDAEIYYEEKGSGPPLLLVPGLGGGGAWWQHQVEAFSPHFRVIIHDHRGAGQSTHSLIKYSVDQMASDVIKLMDGLDIEKAHYAGHSTGGAIGQIIAQDHPERLLSLVLSATWAGPDGYFRRCFESRKETLKSHGMEAYSRASTLMLMPPWWTHENDAELDEQIRVRAGKEPVAEIVTSRIDAIMAFDRRARLGEISLPTLVICAKDDMVTPIHQSDELVAGIPGAEYVKLEHGGHFSPTILPEQFNKPVLEFLQRHA